MRLPIYFLFTSLLFTSLAEAKAHVAGDVYFTSFSAPVKELIKSAHEHLASLRPLQAIADYEKAGQQLHDPRIELGLAQAHLQAGNYQQALALASHTAGAHKESRQAAAVYAYLLSLSGQRSFGLDPVLMRLTNTPPQAIEPYGQACPLRGGGRMTGTALLLPSGDSALVARELLLRNGRTATQICLRNATGLVRMARVQAIDKKESFVLLKLDKKLSLPSVLRVAASDAFAGSIAYGLEFDPSFAMRPAHIRLSTGFVGSSLANDLNSNSAQRSANLGFEHLHQGAVIVNERGEVTAIKLGASSQSHQLALVRALKPLINGVASDGSVALPTNKLGVEQIYQQSMGLLAQVIIDR
jgi:hypothetical protein